MKKSIAAAETHHSAVRAKPMPRGATVDCGSGCLFVHEIVADDGARLLQSAAFARFQLLRKRPRIHRLPQAVDLFLFLRRIGRGHLKSISPPLPLRLSHEQKLFGQTERPSSFFFCSMKCAMNPTERGMTNSALKNSRLSVPAIPRCDIFSHSARYVERRAPR